MEDFTIEIVVDADGNIEMHVAGIDGPVCEGLLDSLLDTSEAVERGHTDDWQKRQTRSARREISTGR